VCGSHKSQKKSLKTPILGFKVVQGHRCWYLRKARQQCLLWCAASLCLSATVLLLDWTTVAETAHFEGCTQIWCIRTDSLNLGGQTVHHWNLRLMPNISYAGCPGLSWMVSAQFSFKWCIAASNREEFTKNTYFGGSRSFKAIDIGTTGKLVSSTCYDKQQVCVYLQLFSR